MRKFIQNKLKDQKGLTLIELLAVIVILAIIAAIAIPAIGNIIENSRVGAVKSDALNVINAAELYFTENDADSNVTLAELIEGSYLDDAGSFAGTGTTAPTVTKVPATTGVGAKPAQTQIDGVGIVGNVTITFTDATKGNINAVGNSERPTTTPVAVTVS